MAIISSSSSSAAAEEELEVSGAATSAARLELPVAVAAAPAAAAEMEELEVFGAATAVARLEIPVPVAVAAAAAAESSERPLSNFEMGAAYLMEISMAAEINLQVFFQRIYLPLVAVPGQEIPGDAIERTLGHLFELKNGSNLTVERLIGDLSVMKIQFPYAYNNVAVFEVVLTLGQSLMEGYYTGWDPMGQPAHGISLMVQWENLLDPDHYRTMFLHSMYLPVYRQLAAAWDATNPGPLLNFLDIWLPLTPLDFMNVIGDHIVIPRLCSYIERWQFKNHMLETVIAPWIRPFGVGMQVVLYHLRLKEAYYVLHVGGYDKLEVDDPIHFRLTILIRDLVAEMQ